MYPISMQSDINILFVPMSIYECGRCAAAAAVEDIDRAAVKIRLGHVRKIYKYASEVWLSLYFF